MDANEITAADNALDYPFRTNFPDVESYNAARVVYYTEKSALETQFRHWLAEEYASFFPASVQDLIWGKAWADGHSSGYGDVEHHYQELAQFAEEVIRENGV